MRCCARSRERRCLGGGGIEPCSALLLLGEGQLPPCMPAAPTCSPAPSLPTPFSPTPAFFRASFGALPKMPALWRDVEVCAGQSAGRNALLQVPMVYNASSANQTFSESAALHSQPSYHYVGLRGRLGMWGAPSLSPQPMLCLVQVQSWGAGILPRSYGSQMAGAALALLSIQGIGKSKQRAFIDFNENNMLPRMRMLIKRHPPLFIGKESSELGSSCQNLPARHRKATRGWQTMSLENLGGGG